MTDVPHPLRLHAPPGALPGLGDTPANYVIAGIYGLGGVAAGDNPALRTLLLQAGGRVFHPWQVTQVVGYLCDGVEKGREAAVYGYSLGGFTAIVAANRLAQQGLSLSLLVTFDAYSHADDGCLWLKHDNVRRAINFRQRNPRSAGRYGWWGHNPYWGCAVKSRHIVVNEIDFTGQQGQSRLLVSHLNIVRWSSTAEPSVSPAAAPGRD